MATQISAYVNSNEGFIWRGRPALLMGVPVILRTVIVLTIIYKLWNFLLDMIWKYQFGVFKIIYPYIGWVAWVYGGILLVGLYQLLNIVMTRYELTTERLMLGRGVFSRYTDQLELYRVRDYQLQEPFLLRIFGLSSILLISTDRTNPRLLLMGIEEGHQVLHLIRVCVENQRRANPATDFDVISW